MQYGIGVILSTACILCGLAYLIRQRIKRVRKFQRDSAVEFAALSEIPYDITSVYGGDRCIYPHRTGGSGE